MQGGRLVACPLIADSLGFLHVVFLRHDDGVSYDEERDKARCPCHPVVHPFGHPPMSCSSAKLATVSPKKSKVDVRNREVKLS